MIGWIVAAAVLVLASVLVLRLRSQLASCREQSEESRRVLHQVQEEAEKRRSDAVLGRMLGDLAGSLVREPAAPTVMPESLVETLVDYHKRVHDYDAAVQYCLQPVELMPGADKDDLEHLMEHVTGARKRLFQARAALVDDDMLQRMPELLQKAVVPVPEDDLAVALATVAMAGRDNHAIELGEVINSALVLTRARNPNGPVLESSLHDLPVLPPWPWLPPTLVNLLQVGMRGCAADTVAHFEARFDDGQVDIAFSGPRKEGMTADEQEALDTALFDHQQRLDEQGLRLAIGSEDQRQHGFTLSIPLSDGAADRL